ncbi:acyl-CoA thioesterase [Chitinimonas lacunae]|uniref:Acyl-CoA thioesterase n=1 Tax=Chitinimonas lacunae TaxID=1963018 RepID=A0ABV8MRS1_9NEIS
MTTPFQPHLTEIKVRGYHLDLYGHVNNARYLEFLEEARWGFTEDQGFLQWVIDSGLAFVIVNINIDYRRPAMMGEALLIETAMKKVGNRSAVIHQTVKLKGTDTLIAQADVTFVMFDGKRGSAVALDGELRERFLSLPTWPEAAASA